MDIQTYGVYLTDDGSHSIISEQFNESYHSRHGALKESLHVFINAGLKAPALTKNNISILEIGLGTGLNAWLTIVENQKLGKVIDFTGIEPYPISTEMAQSLNYTKVVETDDDSHQSCFLRIHEEGWETPISFDEKFTLTKSKSTLENFTSDKKFDLVYFDAFAPNAQPELWTEAVFQQIFELMAPGGIMVTYCAKGTVKRGLKAIGFTVETLEGPPGKREMTRAVKPA